MIILKATQKQELADTIAKFENKIFLVTSRLKHVCDTSERYKKWANKEIEVNA